jgi:benzoylformate decarboxylase
VADRAALERAAGMLARATAPVIVAGDGVGRAGAAPALVTLAETLGAPVHSEPIYRRVNFPAEHPLWRGGLHPTAAGARRALEGADAVLLVGASVFTWFLHTPGPPLRPGVPVIQVGAEADEIGKQYPADLGIVGDPRDAVAGIARALAARMTEEERGAARRRAAALAAARAEHGRRLRAAAEAEAERVPISPAFLMHVLAGVLPRDAVVVDESASSLAHVLRHLPLSAPGSFFGSKTGTLGWAAGAAVGIQLAVPGRKVVVTIGDGSLMYAPQALWTAAHHRLPITYVVVNNASYAILKSGMETLGLASAKRGVFPGMDLVEPEIDCLALSRALGVPARRVAKPGEVREALAEALAHDGPALVDVAIDRSFGRLA